VLKMQNTPSFQNAKTSSSTFQNIALQRGCKPPEDTEDSIKESLPYLLDMNHILSDDDEHEVDVWGGVMIMIADTDIM
jgi:hypothetical protein